MTIEKKELPEVSGFKVLELTMPPLTVTKSHLSHPSSHAMMPDEDFEIKELPVTHQLYFRLHETRKVDPDLPSGRTLFVLNVPVDATEAHFERLFRRCGTVDKVIFKNRAAPIEDFADFNPRDQLREFLKSGAKAHVVFADEDGAERALALKIRKRVWSDQLDEAMESTTQAPLGLASTYT
jgi:ribosomal RNA-processing protein 7